MGKKRGKWSAERHANWMKARWPDKVKPVEIGETLEVQPEPTPETTTTA